jgi:hypothetical protein
MARAKPGEPSLTIETVHRQIDQLSWPDTFVVSFTEEDLINMDSLLVVARMSYAPSHPDTLVGWIGYRSGVNNGHVQHLLVYSLAQNYPNPFCLMTEIKYTLPRDGRVNLSVYNLSGQEVATLVDGPEKAGYHSVRWEPGPLAPGLYFYCLRAGDFVQRRKMLLLY